jgi:hypothetical protein
MVEQPRHFGVFINSTSFTYCSDYNGTLNFRSHLLRKNALKQIKWVTQRWSHSRIWNINRDGWCSGERCSRGLPQSFQENIGILPPDYNPSFKFSVHNPSYHSTLRSRTGGSQTYWGMDFLWWTTWILNKIFLGILKEIAVKFNQQLQPVTLKTKILHRLRHENHVVICT